MDTNNNIYLPSSLDTTGPTAPYRPSHTYHRYLRNDVKIMTDLESVRYLFALDNSVILVLI